MAIPRPSAFNAEEIIAHSTRYTDSTNPSSLDSRVKEVEMHSLLTVKFSAMNNYSTKADDARSLMRLKTLENIEKLPNMTTIVNLFYESVLKQLENLDKNKNNNGINVPDLNSIVRVIKCMIYDENSPTLNKLFKLLESDVKNLRLQMESLKSKITFHNLDLNAKMSTQENNLNRQKRSKNGVLANVLQSKLSMSTPGKNAGNKNNRNFETSNSIGNKSKKNKISSNLTEVLISAGFDQSTIKSYLSKQVKLNFKKKNKSIQRKKSSDNHMDDDEDDYEDDNSGAIQKQTFDDVFPNIDYTDDDEGSLGSIEDLLPLFLPLLEEIFENPDTLVDLADILLDSAGLFADIGQDLLVAFTPDSLKVTIPIILNLLVGKDGMGSDVGAVLGPLIQLIGPLIGPLYGPLFGSLSSTYSGPQALPIANVLAFYFGYFSDERYGGDLVSTLTTSLIKIITKELFGPKSNLDIEGFVMQAVKGTLSGLSSGSSGGSSDGTSQNHYAYGPPAPSQKKPPNVNMFRPQARPINTKMPSRQFNQL
ncbi:hypothetical protein TKK_0007748 [Trichogramma kaykai]